MIEDYKQYNVKEDESVNPTKDESNNNIIINKYPTREELRNLRLKKFNNLISSTKN